MFRRLRQFFAERQGSVSVTMAVLLVPVTVMAGAAIDYSRALKAAAQVQAALDAATINGAGMPLSTRDAAAAQIVAANLAGTEYQGSLSTSFTSTSTFYAGTARITLPMSVMSIAGVDSIVITRQSQASLAIYENACIQSYGVGYNQSDYTITLNGTPSLNLSGCNIQSDTSVKCNGNNNGYAAGTVAVGTVASCNNATSGVTTIPDIYETLDSNIALQCSNRWSVSWSPGNAPNFPRMITVNKSSYVEYHICGDLTLSGTGSLTGTSPSKDTVVVVESGSVTLAAGADLSMTHATIVLTGTDSSTISHTISFPNGNGNGAKLTITPSAASDNPWQGVSIYQDPRLTQNINLSWSSGATLWADGLIYFGRADLTLSGNVSGAGGGCSKLAVNSVTLSGNITLSQADTNCAAVGMKRYQSNLYLMN